MTDERTKAEVKQWLDSITDELRSAEIVPDEECDIAGFLGIEACFVAKTRDDRELSGGYDYQLVADLNRMIEAQKIEMELRKLQLRAAKVGIVINLDDPYVVRVDYGSQTTGTFDYSASTLTNLLDEVEKRELMREFAALLPKIKALNWRMTFQGNKIKLIRSHDNFPSALQTEEEMVISKTNLELFTKSVETALAHCATEIFGI